MVNVLRQALLRAARSDALRRAVTDFGPARGAFRHFVAGDGVDDAVRVVGELQAKGLDASVEHLVGATRDPDEAAGAAETCLVVLEQLAAAGLAAGTDVTVRLAAIGGLVPGTIALDHARALGTAARNVGATLTFGAGDEVPPDALLALVREVRKDFPSTGVALSAHLRRTESDAVALASTGARVRLTRGPDDAPAAVAYAGRHDIDRSFVRSLRALMEGDAHPIVATQDPRLVAIAVDLAQRNHRGPDTFELMTPLGLRPTPEAREAAHGRRLRVLVPFGADAYGHLVGRLADQPDDLGPVLRGLVGRR